MPTYSRFQHKSTHSLILSDCLLFRNIMKMIKEVVLTLPLQSCLNYIFILIPNKSVISCEYSELQPVYAAFDMVKIMLPLNLNN